MPCRDFYSDSSSSSSDTEVKKLKVRADMLARIACKAMTELEKNGIEDFLLLQDDELRNWWKQHKIDDEKAASAKKEKARLAKLKRDALSKLSDEEKKVLGIKVK